MPYATMSAMPPDKQPDGLPLETIFGPGIHDLRPDTLDADLEFSLDAVGDPSQGFDLDGPHRDRLIAWVREGAGRSFQIHPLRPRLQAILDGFPNDWADRPDLHAGIRDFVAQALGEYKLPDDLEGFLFEDKELWIALKK